MKGKAIYKPAGKAGEYSEWACNFYIGCSGECTYCYLKKGRGAKVLGGNIPKLKACFKSEEHALEIFEKELQANLKDLQEHGLFFSFSTDPMLKETIYLTLMSVLHCIVMGIPVKILTKNANFLNYTLYENANLNSISISKSLTAFGFTITGHDEMEPGTSTNNERIEAMRKLHDAGFKTFASIEPVINYVESLKMIELANPYCDLFKVGLESGAKDKKESVREFIIEVLKITKKPIYFKDSLLKAAGIDRSQRDASMKSAEERRCFILAVSCLVRILNDKF